MRQLYFLLLFLVAATSAHAQSFRYTVKLKYKNAEGYSLAQPSAFLSPKAIERRQRQRLVVDSTDLPINRSYIQTIDNVPNVTIVSSSRWLNQLLIETDDINAITQINNLPFVARANPVASRTRTNSGIASANQEKNPETVFSKQRLTSDTINYGNTYAQVHIHEGEYLHNSGFRGQGMLIAMLDAGFSGYKTNPAFDSVRLNNRIIHEYDFVMDETSVDDDHVHGSNCFSILAANRPGKIVGTAPGASYLLYRTEDAATEKPVEEYNWIEAAEKADSAGADMITSSLGYVNFDDPAYNHAFSERDGNTAAITIAADMAVKKGMIVLNSAGNSGNNGDDTKYVMCPADGDSVVTVGAVNTSGVIGGFSSWGPNGAGKLKPNIVSVGWGATYANTAGEPVAGSGTSYSTPNIAGLIACLWQAFPEFTNMEIVDAVQKSADRFLNPDFRYGYGIPNFRVAHNILATKREERTNAILQGMWIKVFPVPFKQVFTVSLKAPSTGIARFRVSDATGAVILEKTMQVQQGGLYNMRLTPPETKRFGLYYLTYSDGKNSTVIKLIGL